MSSLDQLYREVGRALHKAQLAEYNIVSVHLLLGRTGAAASGREFNEESCPRRALGQLLKPTIDSILLPEEAKLFIKTLIAARTPLAHVLFVSSSEVHTQAGVDSLLREVDVMNHVFDRAYLFFEQVLASLVLTAGIDIVAIKEEARATVLSLCDDSE